MYRLYFFDKWIIELFWRQWMTQWKLIHPFISLFRTHFLFDVRTTRLPKKLNNFVWSLKLTLKTLVLKTRKYHLCIMYIVNLLLSKAVISPTAWTMIRQSSFRYRAGFNIKTLPRKITFGKLPPPPFNKITHKFFFLKQNSKTAQTIILIFFFIFL